MDLAEDEALATNAQRVALRPELLKWLGDTLRHHKVAELTPQARGGRHSRTRRSCVPTSWSTTRT